MATNVKPKDLNYDHYATKKYDLDIVRSIPGHVELHKKIDTLLKNNLPEKPKILELGVGTGLTSKRILKMFPNAEFCVNDFSKTMLDGARIKLKEYNVKYLLGDYSKITLPKNNDSIISVIGIHHQKTNSDKKRLFKKIFDHLKKNGIFIFGDLVTYKDQKEAALNDALHFHYLVEHAENKKSLQEWAYHHKYLNSLAPLEYQLKWLKEIGFREVRVMFQKFNTVLIYAKK